VEYYNIFVMSWYVSDTFYYLYSIFVKINYKYNIFKHGEMVGEIHFFQKKYNYNFSMYIDFKYIIFYNNINNYIYILNLWILRW